MGFVHHNVKQGIFVASSAMLFTSLGFYRDGVPIAVLAVDRYVHNHTQSTTAASP